VFSIERILCPTDLSEDSERTLRYAVALARSFGAKLFVCHRPASTADRGRALRMIESLVEAGRAFARGSARELSPLEWEGVMLEGEDLGVAITREAGLRGAHLLFMRSRRRPLAAALLGSTAEAVSRLAPCPVFVMHADEREWLDDSTGVIALRRILVAYDFSPHSELALRHASALAQGHQAELNLLHVLPPPPFQEPEVRWAGAGADCREAMLLLQEAVPAEAHAWCHVQHSVQYGAPYREILACADGQEVDLVAMGAHGFGPGSQAFFGSNVDRVLRQARCPVLIAHPLRPADGQAALA
jgi:nucleotide-binding universal stress UspA family protein